MCENNVPCSLKHSHNFSPMYSITDVLERLCLQGRKKSTEGKIWSFSIFSRPCFLGPSCCWIWTWSNQDHSTAPTGLYCRHDECIPLSASRLTLMSSLSNRTRTTWSFHYSRVHSLSSLTNSVSPIIAQAWHHQPAQRQANFYKC